MALEDRQACRSRHQPGYCPLPEGCQHMPMLCPPSFQTYSTSASSDWPSTYASKWGLLSTLPALLLCSTSSTSCFLLTLTWCLTLRRVQSILHHVEMAYSNLKVQPQIQSRQWCTPHLRERRRQGNHAAEMMTPLHVNMPTQPERLCHTWKTGVSSLHAVLCFLVPISTM